MDKITGMVYRYLIHALMGGILLAGALGCSDSKPPVVSDFVIKTGSFIITKIEFADELELKLTAYPYDFKKNPGEYNGMILDLVSILSEELMMLAAAEEKNILVTQDELNAAETAFREDYPEDSFEIMLLENAISYAVWKKRLKKDVIIDKLVRQDLIDAQEITAEDVMDFYKQYEKTKQGPTGETEPLDEATLVKQLRMEKSQVSYDAWILALKAQYPIQINKKVVADFLIDAE